jgi:hypothetical protein
LGVVRSCLQFQVSPFEGPVCVSRGSGVNQSSSTLVNAAQRNVHAMEVANVDQPHWLTVKGGKSPKMLTGTFLLISILLTSELKGEGKKHFRFAREVPDNPSIALSNSDKNNSRQSFLLRRRALSQATAKQTAKGHLHHRREIEYVVVHAWQVGVLYRMHSAHSR